MNKRNNNRVKFIPDFDSSSSMLFSLGNAIAGSEQGTGIPDKLPKMIGDLVNITPEVLRESIYKLSGIQESLSISRLKKFNDQAWVQWITDTYPEKKFPAVVIGSSNGALIHLCALLGIPWIPQTILLAVARRMYPDELVKDAQWGKKAAGIIRKNIPYTAVYQMHDPIQDRIMVANMGYFRVKRLRLGKILEEYLRKILIPGGLIIVSDCRFQWPSAEMGQDHYFQTGGLGDVSGEEYVQGSRRIEEFLQQEKSKYSFWETPQPLKKRPEAEWGYDSRLSADIRRFAKRYKYRIKRLRFDHPNDLSAPAADLSRFWYDKNGIKDKRLLVECFALIEPWWAARTGSIPFWLPFNTGRSLELLNKYLKKSSWFDEIYLMIMSNAIKGIGCVSVKKWKAVLNKARKKGSFIGVDEKKFPFDLGSFIKYHRDLQKKITARHFIPRQMPLEEFFSFFSQRTQKRYGIKIQNLK